MIGDRYCVASRVVRVRHHRRAAAARRRARRARLDRRGRHPHAPGRRRRARGVLRLRVHLLRAPRLAHGRRRRCRPRAGGWGRSSRARRRRRRADLVIAVPDSGNAAARGFARAAGLPQDDGIIKNRYVARTFIQPGQELRKHGLRLKFNPLPEIVGGQRLVVVDDSIVRGNTTRQIVQMLRDAGARRGPHADLRAADPQPLPLRHRHVDARGDDRPRAHGGRGRRRARRRLAGLPVAGGRLRGDRAATRERHCDACFSGDYPLAGSDEAGGKFSLELPLVRA